MTNIPCTRKCQQHISTIACQYQIIYLSAYQYEIIQYYPKQQSIDEQGKPFIKMQKIQHAASKGTFQIAAFGNEIKKKNSPEWKLENNYMQMTGVREGAPGITATMWGLHSHWIAWMNWKAVPLQPVGRLSGLCRMNFCVCKKKIQTFVVAQINRCADQSPTWSAHDHTPSIEIRTYYLSRWCFIQIHSFNDVDLLIQTIVLNWLH